ncbi:flagellar basal body P-ring formation chaperone FlgA [Campylobacter sp. MIT 12-8780]|uniref:flagellar basal body P-ring formation chaperone FlgA n=1 Tax=Campylobacter sp. MIT 12-8780 TaxID=2202200 RepID=UPI0021AF0325|nr:flagellar basal body P-ring formation chaperone FlgA [Campylobacter sp. MIT 12-8780]
MYDSVKKLRSKALIRKICFLLFVPFLAFGLDTNLEQVKLELIKTYQNKFPTLIIKDIELHTNSLPRDFSQYKFLKLAQGKFNRANGYLRAEFKSPQNLQRNIFLRYFIKADLEVLRANKDLERGQSLSAFDYNLVLMSFDKVPQDALLRDDDLDLIAKTTIRKNSILKKNMFKGNKLIKKNNTIQGLLKDEGLNVLIEVSALESGDKGEIIKVKTKDGKVMQGQIINKNEVLLQ